MTIKTIQLYPDDDINSMRDRLDWAGEEQVIFVIPPDTDLLKNEVDLIVLARHADGLRIQLGLVTEEPELRQKAGALGFPTFLTEDLAATGRREWRRNRVRPDGVGLKSAELPFVLEDAALRRAVREEAENQPTWRYWTRQVVALGVITALLAGALWGILVVTPSATVTLTPAREKISIQRTIVAEINPSPQTDIVTARQLNLVTQWESDLVPSGQAELAANPARGKIVFANLTGERLTVPAGLLITTAAEQASTISFQTTGPVELPAAIGATTEGDIVALEVGPQGNLPSNSLVATQPEWSGLIEVRQPLATSGGNIEPVPVVTAEDREQLRAEVIQQMRSLAAGQIESDLGKNEFLSVESLEIGGIINESWSHDIGAKSNRLSLAIQAEISGTVIDFNQATDLVYTDLVAGVRPGFSLTPDSFRFFKAGDTKISEQGQVTFEMVGEGTMTANLDMANILEEITAKTEDEATQILESRLNLDGEPQFRVIPNWFGRLPNYASRIEIIEEG